MLWRSCCCFHHATTNLLPVNLFTRTARRRLMFTGQPNWTDWLAPAHLAARSALRLFMVNVLTSVDAVSDETKSKAFRAHDPARTGTLSGLLSYCCASKSNASGAPATDRFGSSSLLTGDSGGVGAPMVSLQNALHLLHFVATVDLETLRNSHTTSRIGILDGLTWPSLNNNCHVITHALREQKRISSNHLALTGTGLRFISWTWSRHVLTQHSRFEISGGERRRYE
jgi:hypothetical protein